MDPLTSPTERAAAAESAVLRRFVRHAGPFAWARASWPPSSGPWHYWWHAHLIDAIGDAGRRDDPERGRRRAAALARTVRVRTGGRWVNSYSDDIAWMGLALTRALPRSRGIRPIVRHLRARIDPAAGALPWHVGSTFLNAPANAPAAILLALRGHLDDAEQLTDFVFSLADPVSGLVHDGRGESALYTYNQGTAIGAALALARAGRDPEGNRERAASVIRSVDAWCPDELLPSPGGGDGGLFAGILCRYLAEAARERDADSAAIARRIVRANADALWDGALAADGGPLFSADPRRPASVADAELSVQLGAWLTFEAAATLPA